MTILTAGACGFIVTSSGSIFPAAAGGVAGAVVTGVKLWVQNEAVKAAIGSAVGTGASVGAIAGAATTKTASSAISGALIGGFSSGGIGSAIAGSLAATGLLATSNPLGLLTVGTSQKEDGSKTTFDCWKQVVHESSEKPSCGITFNDLIKHPNVSDVSVIDGLILPRVVIENVWNEKYELEYVILEDSKMYGHVSPIS